MRKTIFALAASGMLYGFAGVADAAMPMPLVAGAGDSGHIDLVRDGCGLGAHRGFYGRCRGNFGRFHRFYGRRFFGRPYYRFYRRGFYY